MCRLPSSLQVESIWLLTREKNPSPLVLQRAYAIMHHLGVDIRRLERVDQTCGGIDLMPAAGPLYPLPGDYDYYVTNTNSHTVTNQPTASRRQEVRDCHNYVFRVFLSMSLKKCSMLKCTYLVPLYYISFDHSQYLSSQSSF